MIAAIKEAAVASVAAPAAAPSKHKKEAPKEDNPFWLRNLRNQ